MNFLKQFYGPTEGPLGFPMPDRAAQALDAILKTLPRSEEFAYRKVVSEKAPSELLPGERSDVSWISSEDPDRANEVVIAKGMNDSQFKLNPIVTLQHSYEIPPVGKSLWRKVVKDGTRRGIKAKTQYPARPGDWPKPPGRPMRLSRSFKPICFAARASASCRPRYTRRAPPSANRTAGRTSTWSSTNGSCSNTPAASCRASKTRWWKLFRNRCRCRMNS